MKPASRLPIIRERDTKNVPIVLVPLDAKGGRWAVVEAQDYDGLPKILREAPWILNDNGSGHAYVKACITRSPGNLIPVHRVLLKASRGQAVRFVGNDRCDLRRSNLTLCKDGRPRRDHFSEFQEDVA
ncbi:hypothetical protein [Aureimonas sp. D3]|uniref:hypothetical protein n=1 Tax=Aureimonas sp. D3 TaxID=1638164 RepID=UPI000782C3DE|nr:hypothetical protein [Aureimonas sp. D3]